MNLLGASEFVRARRPDTQIFVAKAVNATDLLPVAVPMEHRRCQSNSAPNFAELPVGDRQVAPGVAQSLLVVGVVVIVVPMVVATVVEVTGHPSLSATVPRRVLVLPLSVANHAEEKSLPWERRLQRREYGPHPMVKMWRHP